MCIRDSNKQCLANNVIPEYAQVKIKNENGVAKKVKQQSEKLWIKLEIRSLNSFKNDGSRFGPPNKEVHLHGGSQYRPPNILFQANLDAQQNGKRYIPVSSTEINAFLGINLLKGIKSHLVIQTTGVVHLT